MRPGRRREILGGPRPPVCARAPLAVLSTLLVACAPGLVPVTGEKMSPAPAPAGSVLEVTEMMPLVCALHKGQVTCFSHFYFEGADPALAGRAAVAHRIDFPSPVVALTSGATQVCGLTVVGEVHCFGPDIEVRTLDTSLVRIPLDEPAVAIDAAGTQACALHARSGRVSCWGGHFRFGGVRPRTPRMMRGADGVALVGVQRLVGMMALRGDEAFDLQSRSSLDPASPIALSAQVQLADRDYYTRCVADADGAVHCRAGGRDQLLTLGFGPHELSCAHGSCCARGDAAGLTCWSPVTRSAPAQALEGRSIRAFARGPALLCFAASSRGAPCAPVACMYDPWVALRHPEDIGVHKLERWAVEDVLLFGSEPTIIPLCITQ